MTSQAFVDVQLMNYLYADPEFRMLEQEKQQKAWKHRYISYMRKQRDQRKRILWQRIYRYMTAGALTFVTILLTLLLICS